MNIVLMIRTELNLEQAKKLASVRTDNEKEVCGTCILMKGPDMDTLSADIRAIGREVEYINRKEISVQASTSTQHITV